MTFNKFILLLFTFLSLLTACDKDDDSINCDNQTIPIFDFSISKGLGLNENRTYFDSDTFFNGSSIKLEVISPDFKYNRFKWKIGTDPTIRTGKRVELEYDVTGDISVTLISEWTPNTECFPNDFGSDTITKQFHLLSSFTDSKVFGEFEGYYESEPDSLITLYVEHDGFLVAHVNNIPVGCFEDDVYISVAYKDFFMSNYDAKFPCPRPKGFGHISNDNKTLTLEYEIWNLDLGERVSRKFIGNRK